MVELMEWGPDFETARAKFALAGSNCWKKDSRRRSAIDAAHRLGTLAHTPWLKDAMMVHDKFDTDSAKLDLIADDAGFGSSAHTSC